MRDRHEGIVGHLMEGGGALDLADPVDQPVAINLQHARYICKPVDLEIVNGNTRFTAAFGERRTARMTIGNGEGNFFAEAETLDRLEGEGQVVFRYANENPNGSARNIAGIINEAGNVLGMMPHPDRAFEAELGSIDGAVLFRSVLG